MIMHFLSMNKIKKGGGSAIMSEFTMDVASGSTIQLCSSFLTLDVVANKQLSLSARLHTIFYITCKFKRKFVRTDDVPNNSEETANSLHCSKKEALVCKSTYQECG